MATINLTCSCGMRMKAPGAIPGRVGKCPRCGALLKVPDPRPPEPPAPGAGDLVPPSPARPASFVKHRARKVEGTGGRLASDGLVAPPRMAETRFAASLSYPFWNASGISLLAFMPPLLTIGTGPMLALLPTLESGSPVALFAMVFLVPPLLLLLASGGYVLLFLGQVLVTSALGEVLLPRSPGWEISEITHGLGRWFWAVVVGGMVGGLPAVLYWISCGNIDLFDRIVLIDLILPGLAYAQMALLACLIYDSPLAANPVTVTRAILRLGWPYLAPCAETSAVLMVVVGLFAGVLRLQHPFGQFAACWAFWVVALYAAMVTLRRLGLYCYRNAIILEWFPGRTRSRR